MATQPPRTGALLLSVYAKPGRSAHWYVRILSFQDASSTGEIRTSTTSVAGACDFVREWLEEVISSAGRAGSG